MALHLKSIYKMKNEGKTVGGIDRPLNGLIKSY